MNEPELICCPDCSAPLARRVGPRYGDIIAIKRAGIEVLTASCIAIRCSCGSTWRPKQQQARSVLADLETKAG